uniref:Uncharacterized protein n=1 Tax=Romanomermis culicivorax TaxID=13658 RepID=A0A915ITT4_ROMCU
MDDCKTLAYHRQQQQREGFNHGMPNLYYGEEDRMYGYDPEFERYREFCRLREQGIQSQKQPQLMLPASTSQPAIQASTVQDQ